MTDIVERLRINSTWRDVGWNCITNPALLTEAAAEIEALCKHAEALAEHLEWAHEGIERGDLDERMCCDGRMCGCMGASKGDEILHFGREALAAYRAAYPEEK